MNSQNGWLYRFDSPDSSRGAILWIPNTSDTFNLSKGESTQKKKKKKKNIRKRGCLRAFTSTRREDIVWKKKKGGERGNPYFSLDSLE
jgi:hypothetical protein